MKTSSLLHISRKAAITALTIFSVQNAVATPQIDPEGQIEAAELIQMELYHDTSMEGSEISISIEGQVALLSGKAVSIAQAERAAMRAYCSPDVQAVTDTVVIVPGNSSEIIEKATQFLKQTAAISSGKIKVQADGSSLILAGDVGSMDEAEMAREIVSGIPGVTSVQNRLVVNFESDRTDSDIAAQLRFIVSEDPLYYGLDIALEVKDGVASWNGQVGTKGEFDRLVRKSSVTGIKDVHMSGVTVNSDLAMEAVEDKDYTSDQITKAFQTAISRHPEIRDEMLKAETTDGVIMLSGDVPSEIAAASAERTARAIPGVVSVSNALRVFPVDQYASADSVKQPKSFTSSSAPLVVPVGR